jgi:hypothetical protein
MRVLNERKNKSLSCDLNFYKPWKSRAKVDFYLEEKDYSDHFPVYIVLGKGILN